jgi:hypothetical protein
LPNTPFSGNKSFEHPSTPTDQPTFVNGVQQHPIEGVSMAYAFNNAKAAEQHETQYFEMFGNRGIYHKGWTAVTRHKTPWIGMTPSPSLPREVFQVARYSDIDRWSHEGILDRRLMSLNGKSEHYPAVSLGDVVADLENGWSPQCLNRQARVDEWGVLKLGAVSFGEFKQEQNKALPARLKARVELEVRQGDLLISRANILRLVGACALVRSTRANLMLCDKIFRDV